MNPIPNPEDFGVSLTNGFLASGPPLAILSDPYYAPWEQTMKGLQGLILSARLHEVVDRLPILSLDRLVNEAEWQRAYSILAFIAHAYIWGGKKPRERVPAPITIPFLAACKHLELPPVATYAGLVLWNWKPIFANENIDTISNLDMLDTFTGSLDEKWFYIVSVAIEAHGASLIPLMLNATAAANKNHTGVVILALRQFAERIDSIIAMLARMYDYCDPHVFYHRLRPFLAGSKNMAEAGLPNGVIFDNGGPMNKQRYVRYAGGSNAQSSLIQFFDVVLGVTHRPTGTKVDAAPLLPGAKKPAAAKKGFHEDQRSYMPGPHARFLEAVIKCSSIREFVQSHEEDTNLRVAYDACLAMLSAFRSEHMKIVTRYIIVKSQEKKNQESKKAEEKKVIVPLRPRTAPIGQERKDLTGTGGTSLIPFLRQARDETGEIAIDGWTRALLSRGSRRQQPDTPAVLKVQGLAEVWGVGNGEGGLCVQ